MYCQLNDPNKAKLMNAIAKHVQWLMCILILLSGILLFPYSARATDCPGDVANVRPVITVFVKTIVPHSKHVAMELAVIMYVVTMYVAIQELIAVVAIAAIRVPNVAWPVYV